MRKFLLATLFCALTTRAFATNESGALIGAPTAHALGADGRGIVVAVIDTGVRATHADLDGAVVEERCFCRDSKGRGCCPNGSSVQTGSGAARDDFGHGTTAAGIIASRGKVAPLGIAPGAKILAIRVAEANGNVTWTQQVIDAIDSIVRDPKGTRVITMSFSVGNLSTGACDSSQRALATAIDRARAAGIVVIAASGNDAAAHGMRPPACIANVISVGAVYDANFARVSAVSCSDSPAEVDRVGCFSNSDASLDLLAPGAVITSSSADGGVFATGIGTSWAAPHVAAAAAIVLQLRPELTPAEVEALLKSTGRPIVDAKNGLTFPRIDLQAAVTKLVTPAPPPSGYKKRRAVR
ncbi:MAG TPA: S8 family serine peptidase [Thermoanaerobaculia bacterium]|nr:S8 family serine peptidase [Thermoanaerobaculia bacterium]